MWKFLKLRSAEKAVYNPPITITFPIKQGWLSSRKKLLSTRPWEERGKKQVLNQFLPRRKGKNRTHHQARLKITDKYIDSQPGWLLQESDCMFASWPWVKKTLNKVAEYPLFPRRKETRTLRFDLGMWTTYCETPIYQFSQTACRGILFASLGQILYHWNIQNSYIIPSM